MRLFATLLALVLLSSCAGTRTADLDIGENSYFVARLPAAHPAAFGEIRFVMARLDQGRATDWEYDIPSDAGSGKKWHMIAVAPGDYVIMALGVFQGGATWSVCYDASTYRYTIGENEAIYLGDIDPTRNLVELSQQVGAEGQARASIGEFSFVHRNISPPDIAASPASQADVQQARTALIGRHPRAPTNMAWRAPTQATFGNARGPAMVSCGG